MTNTVNIPTNMLPEDGRFGSGPSKIRPEQVQALDAGARNLLGTSHRQTPVKQVVGSIREGLSNFFQIPDGYEVVLGNGGASAFWDIACASLITRKAAFGTYGSFSAKFAKSAQSAPFLEDPEIFAGKPGTYRLPELTEYVDAYCWAHNETSTGVAAPVKRVEGSKEQGALTLIDATSGAGALNVDISQTDAYYFSPQKAFGSDGGLWIAVLSPAAIDRAYGIAKSVSLPGARRWIPPFLSLTSAIENSRKDQTLNTPWPRWSCWRTRCAGLTTMAASPGPRRVAHVPRRCCTSGRRGPITRSRSFPTKTHVPTPWSPSTLTRASTLPKWSPRCARTALWTPTATASSAATSCASACFRPWSRATSRRLRSASITWPSTCDARTEVR